VNTNLLYVVLILISKLNEAKIFSRFEDTKSVTKSALEIIIAVEYKSVQTISKNPTISPE